MKSFFIGLIALVTAYFSGVYSHGYWDASSQIQTTQQAAGVQSLHNDKQGAVNPTVSAETKKANTSLDKKVSTTISINDTYLGIQSLISERNDFASVGKAYMMMQKLPVEDLLKILSLAEAQNDEKSLSMSFLALSLLNEKSLPAAVNYIEHLDANYQHRANLYYSVLTSWAKTDPQAALEWYQANYHQANPKKYEIGMPLSNIFSNLASKDMYFAIDAVSQLSSNVEEKKKAVYGISKSIATTEEFNALFTVLDELANHTVKESAVSAWAHHSPELAAEWADMQLEHPKQVKLRQKVLAAWGRKDKEVAANWYVDNANENERQQAAEHVIDRWGYESPEDALTWIAKQDHIDQDKTTEALFKKAAFLNPEFVIENLTLLENEEHKVEVSLFAYLGLKRENEQAALAMVESSPVRDALKESILSFEESENR